jgi:hypothetical protein
LKRGKESVCVRRGVETEDININYKVLLFVVDFNEIRGFTLGWGWLN